MALLSMKVSGHISDLFRTNADPQHSGTVSTLRILKKDVTEVKKGLECGMNLADFPDLRPGDFLQFYHELEKPGLL